MNSGDKIECLHNINHLQPPPPAPIIIAMIQIPRLLDSGANINVYHPDDSVKVLPRHRPLRAIQPNGTTMASSVEATLPATIDVNYRVITLFSPW